MAETQLGSLRLGNADYSDEERQPKKTSNLIHIISKDDDVLDDITHQNVLYNRHRQSLKDYLETFEMQAFADKSFSEHLKNRNRLIFFGEHGELRELIINESIESRIDKQLHVFAEGSYLEDLTKARVIKAHTTDALTNIQHVNVALDGTGWVPGNVVYAGIRTITFENNTDPFRYLKRVAREFELELDFRVEMENGKIIRYVDMVKRLGAWRGREIRTGKDLLVLERTERTDDVVTALRVFGPEREDGTRLEVTVEDDDARKRWGKNGRHLWAEYEPVTSDLEMSEDRLRQLGEQELSKRINAFVEYKGRIVDLENVPGREHEIIRFADTNHIIDDSYSPELYLESRIHSQERDIFVQSEKEVELGDYVQYTEEEVGQIWQQLRKQIEDKISAAELREYAEPKKVQSVTPPTNETPIWVDTSQTPNIIKTYQNGEWKKATPTIASEVGAETPEGAQQKADAVKQFAENNALLKNTEYSNGLYWDDTLGLIIERSDGLVRVVQNANYGFVMQSRASTNDPWVDVIYFDTNGNAKYAGDIEGRNVNVLEGNFTLEDPETGTKTIIRDNSNMIYDHSFENVRADMLKEEIAPNHAALYTIRKDLLSDVWGTWNNTRPDDAELMLSFEGATHVMHGRQAAVLRGQNYGMWNQNIVIPEQIRNTNALSFSAYVAPFEKTSYDVTVSMRLQLVTADGFWIKDLETKDFVIDHTDKYNWQRLSLTYRGELELGGNRIRARIFLTNDVSSARLLCDAVQVVPYEHPTPYISEQSLFRFMNGYDMADYIHSRSMFSEGADFTEAFIQKLWAIEVQNHAHQDLSLLNGWENYGQTFARAGFTKGADGIVHLRGLIRNGTVGARCAVLPEGCRPYQVEIFNAFSSASGGTSSRVDVKPNGNITIESHRGGFLSLSGISFLAEN